MRPRVLQQCQHFVDEAGTPLGLRYADVAATLDLLAVGDRRDVFDGIRTMEAAALDVLNAKRNG